MRLDLCGFKRSLRDIPNATVWDNDMNMINMCKNDQERKLTSISACRKTRCAEKTS